MAISVEGFSDIHPSYQISCQVCDSDMAQYYDEDEKTHVCADCGDDIAYFRHELNIIEKIFHI